MNSLLQTRSRRIVAAVVSGGLFYFVFGLNPLWLAAWLAPIPAAAGGFPCRGTRGAPAGLAGGGDWVDLGICVLWEDHRAGRDHSHRHSARVVVGVVVIGRTRAAVVSSSHWLTLFVYPVILAAADTLVAFFSPHGSAGSMAFGQMDFLPVVPDRLGAGRAWDCFSGQPFRFHCCCCALSRTWAFPPMAGLRVGCGDSALIPRVGSIPSAHDRSGARRSRLGWWPLTNLLVPACLPSRIWDGL